MAAGISQPGGAGTSTFLEDDTNADANLDADNSTYSLDDVVAKGLASADTTNLGTNAKYFRSKCTIQNGDGAGTTATTFKARNLSCAFDAGKTYAVSTVGQANRITNWGDKVQGAAGKPSGKNGCTFDLAASTTLRGTVQIYGSKIKTSSGFLQIAPGSSGLSGELIDTLMETTNGNITIGVSGFGPQTIYNLDMTLGGTGVLSALITEGTAERMSVAVTGSNAFCINTNAPFAPRDIVFIGTPTTADVKGTNVCALVNPTFTGNAAQYSTIGQLDEWFTFNVLSVNRDTGAFVPNVPVMVSDYLGNVLMQGYTDALGSIGYGSGVYVNCLKPRTAAGNPVAITDYGPFRVDVNNWGTTLPAYAGYSYKYQWPYVNLPSTYGKQLLPVTEIIFLSPPSVPTILAGGGSYVREKIVYRNMEKQLGRARIVENAIDFRVLDDIRVPYRVLRDERGAVKMAVTVFGN